MFKPKKIVDLNALRRKANPSFIAKRPSEYQYIVDYLPPMTASLLNTSPPVHPRVIGNFIAKAGGALPDSFDWTNAVDVATKRMSASAADASKVAAILKPLNQLGCGSCWAFATSSTLADRYTLFQGLSTPLVLSPTYLLACNTDPNDACNGGIAAEAGQFMERTGIPTMSCQDYGWCPASGQVDNSEVPPCTEISSSCYSDNPDGTITPNNNPVKLYKAVPGSTQALPTPESIKAELWHNGPVTVAFQVMDDFMGRDQDKMFQPGWENTSNIYVNLTDPNDPTDSTGLYAGYSSTNVEGGHAVVIVGWGVECNPQGLPDSIKSRLPGGCLPYWKVRNSWGEKWNGDGFFKFAISNPDLNINMTTLMDRSTILRGQTFGGGTTFLPVVDELGQPKVFTSPPGGGGGNKPSPPPPANGGGKPSPPPPANGSGGGGGGNNPPPANGGGGGGGGGNNPPPANGGGGGGGGNNPPPANNASGSSSSTGTSTNFWSSAGGIVTIVVLCLVGVAAIVTPIVVLKQKKKARLRNV